MMKLDGYTVGGALHVVVNNQIGFTTNPGDAHSGRYCTDLAKMVDAPIFHVNGDDPEACVFAGRLAIAYRQTLQERRRDRSLVLPAARPQRGRRADLHAARDVREDQEPPAGRSPVRGASSSRGRRRPDADSTRSTTDVRSADQAGRRADPLARAARREQRPRVPVDVGGPLPSAYDDDPVDTGVETRDARTRRSRARHAARRLRARTGSSRSASSTRPAAVDVEERKPLDWGWASCSPTARCCSRARRPAHRPGRRARHVQPPPRRALRPDATGRATTR